MGAAYILATPLFIVTIMKFLLSRSRAGCLQLSLQPGCCLTSLCPAAWPLLLPMPSHASPPCWALLAVPRVPPHPAALACAGGPTTTAGHPAFSKQNSRLADKGSFTCAGRSFFPSVLSLIFTELWREALPASSRKCVGCQAPVKSKSRSWQQMH